MPALPPELAAAAPRPSPLQRVASLGAAAGVSLVILIGLAQAQRTQLIESEPPFEDLRAVAPPPPPPPPPPEQARAEPVPPAPLELDVAPSPEAVRVALAPTPPAPPARPRAEPSLEFSLDDFRPTSTAVSMQRDAYRVREVDQPPIPIYKKVPKIDVDVLEQVNLAGAVLMYLVDHDGSVQSVYLLRSGSPEFDQAVIQAAQSWRFKPAIKDGHTVRCWVRHRIEVDQGSGRADPFSTH